MPKPSIMKLKRLWTGKQLFSLIIPQHINYTETHSTHPDLEDSGPYKCITYSDTKVLIEDGELISGILCKNSLGSLIHVITLEQNSDVLGSFFNKVQIVANNSLESEGHSIGIVDCLYNSQTRERIKQSIDIAEDQVFSIIDKCHNKELQ